METPRLRAGPFVLAIGVSLLLVISAPFVGQLRSEIRRAFPGQFVHVVGSVLALGLVGALGAAFSRIRDHRLQRYGAIALALLIAVGYSAYRAGPNPESNAVERFHFLQYGLITFLFYRAWRPLGDLSIFLLPIGAGIIVGTVEEWFQWFIPNRVGEMADILLNLVAIGTGMLFSAGVEPPQAWRGLRPESRARLGRVAAAAIVVVAAFIHIVHLGHVIVDDEAGAFASRFTRERILELQAQRRAQWAASPPPTTLVRLSREDQYLTEGVQHVRERNRMWEAGNIAAAWRENRILEQYYEPVLDTPTHEGAGHRWPAEQRADAEARGAAPMDRPYESDAYPLPILTWNPVVFWILVTSLVAAVLLSSLPPQRRQRRREAPRGEQDEE